MLPNFGEMDSDQLMSFWARYHRPSRKHAAFLVGDKRAGYTTIAARLANYACNLATWKDCLTRGDTTAAECYEHAASLCYERLPMDIREHLEREGKV